MAVVKYKEGTLDALSNGWEKSYTLRLYKNTSLDPDGEYSDFTEATATTGYTAKTLTWATATVSWDAGLGKYKAVWPNQVFTSVTGLEANGWFLTDTTNKVYSAEAQTMGANYSSITLTNISIIMG